MKQKKLAHWKINKEKKSISYLSKPKTMRQKWATCNSSSWYLRPILDTLCTLVLPSNLTCKYNSSFPWSSLIHPITWYSTVSLTCHSHIRVPRSFSSNDFSLCSLVVFCLFEPQGARTWKCLYWSLTSWHTPNCNFPQRVGNWDLGWPENLKAHSPKTYSEVKVFYDHIIFGFTANILHLNSEL